jgi:hypothetical protein
LNVDNCCEWLRRQGHRVIHTKSSYWYDAGPGVLQAFPHHWIIRPAAEEIRELTFGKGNLALRYSTPVSAPDGAISYHVVLRNPYNMEMLRHQARNAIRRGLGHCSVEQIPLRRLALEGWALQQDTLKRQNRLRCMTQAGWERTCLSAEDLPGFEAWAAIVEGRLAATIITARMEETCFVPSAQAGSRHLRMHVNNALFYAASRAMLARDGVQEVFFGLHSLDAPESVDEFKFRMGLMARPVRQRVVFHPAVQPFANRLAHQTLSTWMAHDPCNWLAAKAEGMLRFHLQSRLPLDRQCWPDCLSEYRKMVLGVPPAEGWGRESGVRVLMEEESPQRP